MRAIMTAWVTLASIGMMAWVLFLAGCGESVRAGDGGSQSDGTRAAVESTTDGRPVEEHASKRAVVARAGDVEARAGRRAVARAGDDVVARGGAVARAGDVKARANDGEPNGSGDPPRKVDLEVGGERGTRFSGTCSVGGDERRIGGLVPKSYSFEPGGEKVECEIHKDGKGALEVVLAAGDGVRSVQRQAGAGSGTITVTYSASSTQSRRQ